MASCDLFLDVWLFYPLPTHEIRVQNMISIFLNTGEWFVHLYLWKEPFLGPCSLWLLLTLTACLPWGRKFEVDLYGDSEVWGIPEIFCPYYASNEYLGILLRPSRHISVPWILISKVDELAVLVCQSVSLDGLNTDDCDLFVWRNCFHCWLTRNHAWQSLTSFKIHCQHGWTRILLTRGS